MKAFRMIPTLCFVLATYGTTVAETHHYPAGEYTGSMNLLGKVAAKAGDTIDCRNAVFHQHLLNAKGDDYPVRVNSGPGDITVRFARVIGHDPWDVPWQIYYSKANSAALLAKSGGSVEFRDCFVGGPEEANGCVWDYARWARQQGETRNRLTHSACILGRDDLETDTGLKNLTVESCLFYSYVGFSSRPGGRERGNATHRDITIRNSIMRMFPCLGNSEKWGTEPLHGAPFKWRKGSQKYVLHNFVVAVGWPRAGRAQIFKHSMWGDNWSGALGYVKEATGDNVFCYLDDDGFEDAVPLGPFRLLEGEEARAYLTKKVVDWIEAHEYWREIWPDYEAVLVKNVLQGVDTRTLGEHID